MENLQHLYKPLDRNKKQIRLLTIRPIGNDRIIRCDLQVHSLYEDCPAYEALSYAWDDIGASAFEEVQYAHPGYCDSCAWCGQPDWTGGGPRCTQCGHVGRAWQITRAVEVNGWLRSLTANLLAALHHLRHPKETRTMWIDAICINQEDPDEQSHQVRFMRTIYERASRTIVWLGVATEGSDEFFDAAQRSIEHVQMLSKNGVLQPELRSFEVLEDRNLSDLAVFGSKLLRRPYFERIWIVQEIVVSPDIHVVAGDRVLRQGDSLLWFTKLLEHVSSMSQVRLLEDRAYGYLEMINELRKTREEPIHKLHALLDAFWNCKSKDPRDKVFALLGIASDADMLRDVVAFLSRAFEDDILGDDFVDYRRTLGNVYTIVAHYILICEDYSILYSAHDSIGANLPSWVPDWSERRSDDKTSYQMYQSWCEQNGLSKKENKVWSKIKKSWFPYKLFSSLVSESGSVAEHLSYRVIYGLLCGQIGQTFKEGVEPPDLSPEDRAWFRKMLALPGHHVLMNDRRWARLGRGVVGLITRRVRRKDRVYFLGPCEVPLVVRPVSEGRFILVGDFLSREVANGSAFNELASEEPVVEGIILE